ncbi:hypothetical protein B0J12DRAFT_693464 [Macrophomina phaseolina]|uniref:Uncharacterized protein n=1 Tax=Macrophomina phaseolina TaxID=35725 RepID=A0ABQ8GY41_9PEZI|nr:hypothetical protein B0J12DRAFT_693464 [Macrophomina phaseolina]
MTTSFQTVGLLSHRRMRKVIPRVIPRGPNSCLLGATTEPAIAGASAGSVEASAAGEGSGLGVDSTANAPRKRKRVSFAGDMTGDATGEPVQNDTSQDQHQNPAGRSHLGFDRLEHDQTIHRNRQKARERMAVRFNANITSVQFKVGDVGSAQIPPNYPESSKTAVLVGVVHKVIQRPQDYKMYILQDVLWHC